MKKTTKLYFKPHFWKAIHSDARRVYRKRYRKYFYDPLYITAGILILGILFISIQKVFAQAPIQEVGIKRQEYAQIKPLNAPKYQKVEYVSIKTESPAAGSSEPQAGNCVPDNKYASFIYLKESGCDPSAVNPSGCRGLGQACPGDKLPCEADFACQHAYFTQYANDRYGGWEQAYNFWLQNNWW